MNGHNNEPRTSEPDADITNKQEYILEEVSLLNGSNVILLKLLFNIMIIRMRSNQSPIAIKTAKAFRQIMPVETFQAFH